MQPARAGIQAFRQAPSQHFSFPYAERCCRPGWWIPNLTEGARVPSCSFLPRHCSRCRANRSICAAARWKAAGNWSSQRAICWKDLGEEGLELTPFGSDPARAARKLDLAPLPSCELNPRPRWGSFLSSSQRALSAECQISLKTSHHPKF